MSGDMKTSIRSTTIHTRIGSGRGEVVLWPCWGVPVTRLDDGGDDDEDGGRLSSLSFIPPLSIPACLAKRVRRQERKTERETD